MDFERIKVPPAGDRVRYDTETEKFSSSGEPIVPFVYGDAVGESVVSAARRVLDTAADEMGRGVRWMRVYAGSDAVDRYGTPLPDETVRALESFRVGLVGPIMASNRDTAESLRRRLDLTAEVQPVSHLNWTPSSVSTRNKMDIVCFRDITEDTAARLEFGDGSAGASYLREFLENEDGYTPPDGEAAFGIRPVSRNTTERLVRRAAEYAFDSDRNRLTVVHQGDQLPATEGGFRRWATDYLEEEYSDSVVSEEVFEKEYDAYPEDKLVVGERYTDEVCRELLTRPSEYDVLVAPSGSGAYVSTVASEAVGGCGVTPSMYVGDGHVLAGSSTAKSQPETAENANPIATIRAGCLIFELLGWEDAAGVVRDSLETTLSEGVLTRDLTRRTARAEVVGTEEFADTVVEGIYASHKKDSDGTASSGVRTTAQERAGIKRMIAGLYNILFEDWIGPTDIELNQLRKEDEEADIYLPEVGINFRYWRLWSAERRVEVLLHELAHIENYDDGHAPSFYDRLVELTFIAEDWQAELELLFDDTVDFDVVKRLLVESVHEDTIETDIESVEDRKHALREDFGLTSGEHY